MRGGTVSIAVVGLIGLGCHSSSSSSPPSSASGSTASGGATTSGSATASGTAAGSSSGAPAAANAHPLPAAMADKLRVYGRLHGTPLYIPATKKDVEHWLAFVGTDTVALSAWLVTPSDAAHTISAVGEWPIGVKVAGAMVEVGPHGQPGNPDSSFANLLVESRPGLGQPGGLHGLLRIEIDQAQYVSDALQYEGLLVDFAGAHDLAAVDPALARAAADDAAAAPLFANDASDKLAARLTKADAADLAPLVPKAGVTVVTDWQKTFLAPTSRTVQAGELHALLAGNEWTCPVYTCIGGDMTAVFGGEDGHPVLRAILRDADDPPQVAGVRKVVAGGPGAPATLAALHAQGQLDVRVIAEAPNGARGTVAVAADGDAIELVVRDGDVVQEYSTEADAKLAADQIRFVDADGDGLTDVAYAVTRDDGSHVFELADQRAHFTHDDAFTLTSIDAMDLDDAVARALAVPERPVTAEAACALLGSIKSARSLAKAGGGKAVIYSFTEPSEPELNHEALGKDAAKELQADLSGGCHLACDPLRPVCTTTDIGPQVDFFLFGWAGDTLQLVIGTVYRGA